MAGTVILDGVDQAYADEEFGEWWSDIASGLSKTAEHRLEMTGVFPMSTPADFTAFRGGFTVTGNAARIEYDGVTPGGGTILEMGDSAGIVIIGLTIVTTSDFPAENAITMGRISAESYRSAGKHTFIGVGISGYFSNAVLYNVSSETVSVLGCRFDNLLTTGRYGVFWGDRQRSGDLVSSAFSAEPDHDGSTSSTGGQWSECRIASSGTHATLYNYGFDRMSIINSYVQATEDADAQAVLDTTAKGIVKPVFDNIYFHGEGSTSPAWTCIARGSQSNGVSGLHLVVRHDGVDESAGGGFFKLETVREVNGITLRGSETGDVTFHSTSEVHNAFVDTRQDLTSSNWPLITLGDLFVGTIVCADSVQIVGKAGAEYGLSIMDKQGAHGAYYPSYPTRQHT